VFSVSMKTQYGIRALVHLARTGSDSATSAEIAKAEGISPKYLEGILGQLKAAGLVTAERGQKGGYRLARAAAEIPMIEIVGALDGQVKPVLCVDDSRSCAQGGGCLPRRFWLGLKGAIDGYLASRTLQDVIEG
ncbi:MAG TPA: Rrf2 family transcriptional regulator, partial [Spirochaetales bacterium]|nr:Rrf2 family transcriptional regulator [Spirochaetales bacterium]